MKIAGVDLFCGAGGLTKGLQSAGIQVVAGVDIDPACEYPFSANNEAEFVLKSVTDIKGVDLRDRMSGAPLKLLAGCAPCQPFSTYMQGKTGPRDARWNLLREFKRLVLEVKPDLVTMENVPRLQEQRVFAEFVSELEEQGFDVNCEVVNCADYGVPQLRNRLVLLASKLGPIRMIAPTHSERRHIKVADVIGNLPALKAGEICDRDPLHQACGLSPLNLKRIRASRPGGSWRDWDKRLVADCHKRATGKSYPSVYGRMSWDDPAPTVTTQFFGFGSGRFGHPEQDRAISLREGAMLQSFPRTYKFTREGHPIYRKTIGRLIGNAVPVKLGEAIGRSLIQHVRQCSTKGKRAA